MKILYLHRTQGEEPESIHILSIVSALRKQGHDVEILGPSKKDMASAGTNVRFLSAIKRYFPKILFEMIQILYNFLYYFKIKKYLGRYRPDFIYERYALYSCAGVIAARHMNIPLILEVNTPYAHAWNKYYRLYFPKLAKYFERRILNSASHVITVTDIQKEFLVQKYLKAENISVCHNAINVSEFNPDIKPAEVKWSVPDPVVIGFVGTMNRWQGIPVLSSVIPEVVEKTPNAVFLMVGDGEYRQQLEADIEKCGCGEHVYFTGRVAHKDIPGYISSMDITILPDSNEYGSPMKVFEYMAMKKAVIAPDVPPVQEIIEQNSTGIIIRRSNKNDLSDAIIELINNKDKRCAIADSSLEYVVKNHTWDVNASKIVETFNALSHSN